ncbi:MAG: pyridoxal phosphate-dependent aminotransferase [Candidatus Abyssobacteria bacterium SURF_5]|uniref:Aminotransferase n=1 Tax=Abyssobacteria bacterium (strain SURF_5) TaxID=2093360 RepID=A0A3A4MUK3_ABYX5|nr:MAG: pyridoxal phosphate-dependent aminotransferase [Candidatus Abyssubacteria bacterium SURF_5]
MKRPIDIPPFLVMEVLERAQELERQGRHIIHLEVGEPDFPTPECIKEAAVKALRDERTHYSASVGILPLREAVCESYRARYGVDISPDRVVVTSGTSPGFLLVLSCILQERDEVILPNPHYACYPQFIKYAGGAPAFVDVKEETGYELEPGLVRRRVRPKTRAVLLNSPANPTGHVMDGEVIRQLASVGPVVVSDEIYHGLVYKGKEHTALEYTDDAFVLNGFSKLYSMTGWRLGYIITPMKYQRLIQKMQQNFFIAANTFVQWAGVAALKEAQPDVDRMVACFNERRKLILRRIREIGFKVVKEPTGAFYVLANARRFTRDSLAFAFEVLENAGVGIAPGIDFGSNAEGFVRFSYANSLDNIEEGMRRLEEYLSSDGRKQSANRTASKKSKL